MCFYVKWQGECGAPRWDKGSSSFYDPSRRDANSDDLEAMTRHLDRHRIPIGTNAALLRADRVGRLDRVDGISVIAADTPRGTLVRGEAVALVELDVDRLGLRVAVDQLQGEVVGALEETCRPVDGAWRARSQVGREDLVDAVARVAVLDPVAGCSSDCVVVEADQVRVPVNDQGE